MFKTFNPVDVLEPQGPYVHGLEIPPNSRLLFVSGQTAGRLDGTIPATIEEQAEMVWSRIAAVLRDADMQVTDIVKVNSYLRHRADAPGYARVRGRYLAGHRPAMLGLVAELFRAEYLLEVEVIAARSA
jgi:2-iminobutanoate/2-iminopropanoate deaminase